MKLNLGCGNRKIDGFINIDSDPLHRPDKCFDLLNPDEPWPFEDSSVDEIIAEHFLEHIEGRSAYFHLWKEIYRVTKNDALIKIEVPHWKHENFFHDPTHCRAVTPIGLAMMSQKRNINDLKNNGRESKLGLSNRIDFDLAAVNYQNDYLGDPIDIQMLVKTVKPQRVLSENDNIV